MENRRDAPVKLEFELKGLRASNGFLSLDKAKVKILEKLAPIALGFGNRPIAVRVLPSGKPPSGDVTLLELYREMLTAIHACPTSEDVKGFLHDFVRKEIIPILDEYSRQTIEEWLVAARKDLRTEDNMIAEIAEAKASVPSDVDIRTKRSELARVSGELGIAKRRSEGNLRQSPFANLKI